MDILIRLILHVTSWKHSRRRIPRRGAGFGKRAAEEFYTWRKIWSSELDRNNYGEFYKKLCAESSKLSLHIVFTFPRYLYEDFELGWCILGMPPSSALCCNVISPCFISQRCASISVFDSIGPAFVNHHPIWQDAAELDRAVTAAILLCPEMGDQQIFTAPHSLLNNLDIGTLCESHGTGKMRFHL